MPILLLKIEIVSANIIPQYKSEAQLTRLFTGVSFQSIQHCLLGLVVVTECLLSNSVDAHGERSPLDLGLQQSHLIASGCIWITQVTSASSTRLDRFNQNVLAHRGSHGCLFMITEGRQGVLHIRANFRKILPTWCRSVWASLFVTPTTCVMRLWKSLPLIS